MAESKKQEPTKEYIVVRKHCLDHKVGAMVKLTDRQAKNLSGKVRLKKEFERRDGVDAKLEDAQKEIADLKKQLAAKKATK